MLAIRLLVIYECYLFSSCVLSTCNTDMIKCNAGNLLYKQHTWTLACVIRRYFKCFQKKTSSATNQIQQRLIETTFLGSFFFFAAISVPVPETSLCAPVAYPSAAWYVHRWSQRQVVHPQTSVTVLTSKKIYNFKKPQNPFTACTTFRIEIRWIYCVQRRPALFWNKRQIFLRGKKKC